MIWVPGQSGVGGNEAAGALANRTAGTVFMEPEPFSGILRFVANEFILCWMRIEHTARWKGVACQRMSKMVLQDLDGSTSNRWLLRISFLWEAEI